MFVLLLLVAGALAAVPVTATPLAAAPTELRTWSVQLDALGFPAQPAWGRHGPGLHLSVEQPIGRRVVVGVSQGLHLLDPDRGFQLYSDTQLLLGAHRHLGTLELGALLTAGVHAGLGPADTGAASGIATLGATPMAGAVLGARWWVVPRLGLTTQLHVPFFPFERLYLDGEGRMLTVGFAVR